jgi:hypothetical protein
MAYLQQEEVPVHIAQEEVAEAVQLLELMEHRSEVEEEVVGALTTLGQPDRTEAISL